MTIVMVIDGHDIRYCGDGHRWLPKSDPGWTGSWADLKRTPYTYKVCMNCGVSAAPDAVLRPCHELWSEKTGYPGAASKDAPVYYPIVTRRETEIGQ